MARVNGNTSGSDAEDIGINGSRSVHVESHPTTPSYSIISEVVKGHKKKTRKNKYFSKSFLEDKILNDTISRTHKCDGR